MENSHIYIKIVHVNWQNIDVASLSIKLQVYTVSFRLPTVQGMQPVDSRGQGIKTQFCSKLFLCSAGIG